MNLVRIVILFRIDMRVVFCLIVILVCNSVNAQTLFAKGFVKQGKVLLRWAPENKELFDLGAKNGYKITRTVNGQSATLINDLKPYSVNDERWTALLKRNKSAILITEALYKSEVADNNSIKEKQQKENLLFGLMLLSCDFDNELSMACGLYFVDSLIDNSSTCEYKIEINALQAKSKKLSTNININTSKLSSNQKIQNLNLNFRGRNAKLKWNTKQYLNEYGGYVIERSIDSVSFGRINKSPVILLTSQYEKDRTEIIYNDTVEAANTKFYYRIRGINHFGEMSQPSNVVSGISYADITSFPIIDSVNVIKRQKVFLKWKMSKAEENIKVKKYVIFRSNKDSGPYTIVYTSDNDRSNWVDERPGTSNYYKVGAVSFGHDTTFSFSRLVLIADTISPDVPKELKAKVGGQGLVTLTWLKNSEKDIQGYKIYKANSLKEEFVQINKDFVKDAEFKDKLNLNTLSKTIYYAVAATDNNYNSSALSKPIEVKRPDTIPPIADIIKMLTVAKNGVEIRIVKSSSDDIKTHVLYRKEIEKADVRVAEWSKNEIPELFTDTTAELGLGYFYKIIVSDEDDNIAVSNSSYIKNETGFRKKVKDVAYEVDRKNKFIKLDWKYNEKEVEKFIIYRSSKKEPLTIIKTLPFPLQTFTDKTPSMGNFYEYRIKAVYTNGAESVISDAVVVEY